MTTNQRLVPSSSMLGRVGRSVFLVCAFLAGTLLILREQEKILAALAQANFLSLLFSLMLGIGHVGMAFVAWHFLIRTRDGGPTIRTAARMFFLGQMGKYVPGGFWSFVGVAEFGRASGLDRRGTIASQMLAMLICLGVGAVIGLATVPQAIGLLPPHAPYWLIALAIPPIVLLHPGARGALLRLMRIDFYPSLLSLALSGAMMAVLWLFAGAQLVVLSGSVGADLAWSMILTATGIYAVSWTAGFLFVIAPAGIGAREAILLALLSTYMTLPQAMTVALLSRVAMTIGDFFWAAIAGLTLPGRAAQ